MGHHQYFSLAIRGDDHDSPLDFSLITGLRFGGACLEFIEDIDVHLNEVEELLDMTPEDTIVTEKWFVNTFRS